MQFTEFEGSPSSAVKMARMSIRQNQTSDTLLKVDSPTKMKKPNSQFDLSPAITPCWIEDLSQDDNSEKSKEVVRDIN